MPALTRLTATPEIRPRQRDHCTAGRGGNGIGSAARRPDHRRCGVLPVSPGARSGSGVSAVIEGPSSAQTVPPPDRAPKRRPGTASPAETVLQTLLVLSSSSRQDLPRPTATGSPFRLGDIRQGSRPLARRLSAARVDSALILFRSCRRDWTDRVRRRWPVPAFSIRRRRPCQESLN